MRKKDVASYPSHFAEFFERAIRGEVVVEFESETDARRARDKFYGFRAALREQPEHNPSLALQIDTVVFSLNGEILTAKPSSTATTDAIRQALAAE